MRPDFSFKKMPKWQNLSKNFNIFLKKNSCFNNNLKIIQYLKSRIKQINPYRTEFVEIFALQKLAQRFKRHPNGAKFTHGWNLDENKIGQLRLQ